MAQRHAILSRLLTANAQWSKDVQKVDRNFFKQAAQGQSPKVLWIGCADSRVPESVITASRPGDIFVHRNIANQFHADDVSAQAILQFAVDGVGVEHVVVVGHTQCAGALACLKALNAPKSGGPELPVPTHSPSEPLNVWLMPMMRLAESLNLSALTEADAFKELVEQNVKAQIKNIRESATMKKAWGEGKNVWVHGWVFEIEQGLLKDLEVSVGSA